MINQIIEAIEPALKALTWVDRYGGIVRTAIRITPDEEGDFFEESFPVSCDTTGADCFNTDSYLELVPDDSKKSVSYFEDSGLNYQGSGRAKRASVIFTGSVRFVTWFNCRMIGIDTCDIHPYIIGDLVRIFNQKFDNFQASQIRFLRIKFELDEIESKSPGPFTEYAYEDRQHLLLKPYDHISININVEAEILKNCLPSTPLQEPLIC